MCVPAKAGLVANHLDDLIDAAAARALRFYTHGDLSARLSPIELVKYGFRGLVFPEIKREYHPGRKVYDANGKRLKTPRWRTILTQCTIDFLVHKHFEYEHNEAIAQLWQYGSPEEVVRNGNLIGMSTTDAGVRRIEEILAHFKRGLDGAENDSIVESDASGIDWAISAGDGIASPIARRVAHMRWAYSPWREKVFDQSSNSLVEKAPGWRVARRLLLNGASPAEVDVLMQHSDVNWHRPAAVQVAANAFGKAGFYCSISELNSCYQVGATNFRQNDVGVCQSGAVSTSEVDGEARLANTLLTAMDSAVLVYGDDQIKGITHGGLLNSRPSFRTAFDERDVCYKRMDEPLTVCSRTFTMDGKFELRYWQKSIAALSAEKDEEMFKMRALGVSVECRYTDEALAAIDTIVAARGWTLGHCLDWLAKLLGAFVEGQVPFGAVDNVMFPDPLCRGGFCPHRLLVGGGGQGFWFSFRPQTAIRLFALL